MTSHKLELQFVGIPKCMFTSIGTAMQEADPAVEFDNHARASEHEFIDGYTIFTITRHPFDRFISTVRYVWANKSQWHDEHNPHPDHERFKNASPSEILYALKKDGPLRFGVHWRPQSHFVDRPVLHFKMEEPYSLQQFLAGFGLKAPHLNASTGPEIELCGWDRLAIHELYKEDFDRFYPHEN